MEAEAQCATLEELGLVDGVITDDSDVFLFGAKRVFKNIFEQTKFVESYRSSDIETELHVDRRKLIYLAHLLGSDYAAGVHGIGIVNALEVLAAFPGENGLKEFRAWAKTLGNDPKPPPKQRIGWSDDEDEEDEDAQTAKARRLQAEFKYKHRNQKKGYLFEDDFPRAAVTREYLKPQVDRSPAPFSWSGLQHAAMVEWCDRTLGWDREQTDLKLKPAVDAAQQRQQQGTQQRLSQYFEPSRRVASIRSVRMANAVNKLAGDSKRAAQQQRSTGGNGGNGNAGAGGGGGDAANEGGGGGPGGRGSGSGGSGAVGADDPPRAADDTPLDAAAASIMAKQKKKKQQASAAASASKPSKKKKKKKQVATNKDGSPKSARGRSGYMIFLCVPSCLPLSFP
jgi:uncharacterized membrane protein YgcG